MLRRQGEDMPGYGWKPSPPDDRDLKVGDILEMIARGEAAPISWECDIWLCQGDTEHCVGFAGAYFEATANACGGVDNTISEKDANDIYYECKKDDGEPLDETGTYSRTLGDVLKKRNVIYRYVLSRDMGEILSFMQYGPVVLGLYWYSGMNTKDANGYIHPYGKPIKGHEVLARAEQQGEVILRNSWGKVWGECRITNDELRICLGDGLLMVRQPVISTLSHGK
jgi:hypothetical protein